jgi:predicted DNA-binding protein (MmcQ/YjbR family)
MACVNYLYGESYKPFFQNKMISTEQFTKLANSFPEAEEHPHFEKSSFRVNKKIFATLDVKNGRACLKLSAADQGLFSVFDKTAIYPVPGNWGKKGWTYVELKKVRKDMLADALVTAYCEVAPAKLRALLKLQDKN